jgi:hypothetical protein
MSEQTNPPRLGTVAFRGVGNRLPPRSAAQAPAQLPVVEEPGDQPKASDAPEIPADEPASRSMPRLSPPRPTRLRPAATQEPRVGQDTQGTRTRVGTGQLQARLPLDLAQWIRQSNITQRALLLAAFADHSDEVAPSNDPIILSRQRLGLPIRPGQKRRGPTELINFSLTGEEKDLIESRAAQLSLSIVDFVTEILRRSQNAESPSLS